MTHNEKLEVWILQALDALGGEGTITQIAKHVWENHESELRVSDDVFFKWQYSMRWAGQRLQKAGKLKKHNRYWAKL